MVRRNHYDSFQSSRSGSSRALTRILGSLALVAGLGSTSCGDPGALGENGAELARGEPTSTADDGLTLSCTPPAKLTCPPPPPDSGVKFTCFCLTPPPVVQTATLVPDFYVTQVIYAPPGKSSNINYSSSTSMGSTTTCSHGFKDDVKVTAEASGSFFGGASVSVSGGISSSTNHSDALDVSTQFSQGYKKSGQVDRIDHNYDEIWFLIRPKIDISYQAGATSTQQANLKWKFGQQDGFNNGILQFVYAGWLNNAMQMPSDVKNTLDYYGITADKYATLLHADPLFTGISPNQTMDASRYDYLGVFPFEPPFAQGDQASTQSFSIDQKTTNTSTASFDDSYSVGLSASGSFNAGVVSAKLSISSTWTWTSSSSFRNSNGTGMTDSFTVGQPAYGYTGPTLLHVYVDKIYHTYAFTLDYPQGEQNLALGQPSYQSSDVPGYYAVASLANDGNTDGNFWDGSVSHTDSGYVTYSEGWPGQYWYVDLGSERVVNSVRIFNRTDCCSERLSHFNILAYDSMQGYWKVISDHSQDNVAGISFLNLPVSMTRTQYVMVAKTDDNNLQLAEVEVMGF